MPCKYQKLLKEALLFLSFWGSKQIEDQAAKWNVGNYSHKYVENV